MKRFSWIVVLMVTLVAVACNSDKGKNYHYETVEGDKLGTRIYTLDNGLKVYMSVNKEQPRLQTMIAVRVGSKNDPAETTGLAHYFEHLMFKGTDKFGTQNYEAEKPLLDEIERLFEVYRTTTDEAERKAIYAQIDSVSQEASKFAIPNEYDKLMQAIGASGTNAWTSFDETNYVEDIPSNQIENWAKIQSERFANAVIRGFHTELETVYEEYNMGLTRDDSKMFDEIVASIFPDHPYGTQTTIGAQEHLKNPSITNIKNYYKTYYVPNNMAICMAGDFDPDEAIKIIDKYFGGLKPNENLPKVEEYQPKTLTKVKESEVYGLESEAVAIAWPVGGARSEGALVGEILSSVLSNGSCGLIDTDLLQSQKVLNAYGYIECLSDAGIAMVAGEPKQGQTLEEVRDLLLAEVEKLRNGEFDEELLKSIIANYRKSEMSQLENNFARAYKMEAAFINGLDWADVATELDRAAKITKEDLVAWAKANLTTDGYSVIYKRQGEDKSQKKIEKPTITPISSNRDAQSDYLVSIQQSEVAPIAPVFVDFERDMSRANLENGTEVLYKQNETNELFSLIYFYDFGATNFKALPLATQYMEKLGTAEKSAEQIQRELYDLACDFQIVTGLDKTYIAIGGLSENMEKAMKIAEDYIANVKGDEEVLREVKRDAEQERLNAKSSQQDCFGALQQYCIYGPAYVRNVKMSNNELKEIGSEELLSQIKALLGIEHRVMYYGPMSLNELSMSLQEVHCTSDKLQKVEEPITLTPSDVKEPSVLFAQYDAKQIYYMQYSCRKQDKFDVKNSPVANLYNNYFSGGMNSIVFQEMREARGLAYSANAGFWKGTTPEDPYYFYAFIATQNDKTQQAVEAFDEIIEDMPRSDKAFDLAKSGLLANLESKRTTKANVLWSYLDYEKFGLKEDINKTVYEGVTKLTLDDVVKFQQSVIKGRPYTYCILGDKNDLDMEYVGSLGKIKFLSQEEIFGY